jgi:hypothetical protein
MTFGKAKEIVENEISNICDKELSEAWDTVLRASEDSIPKEKIREKIKELKSIEPRDDEYNYDLQNEVGFKLDALNELLRE